MTTLLIDVSSVARWIGPPVGMIRVQSEIARTAASRPDAMLVFFDPSRGTLRRIEPRWESLILGPNGCIDLWTPTKRRGATLPSRYAMFLMLERLRLKSAHRGVSAIAAGLQSALLKIRRHSLKVEDAAGHRIARLTIDLALGEDVVPKPNDTLLLCGSGWYHLPAGEVVRLKAMHGFRLAALCYDIIPILRPDWFPPEDAEAFRQYWQTLFPALDRIIVNAEAIGRDVAAHCKLEGLEPAAISVVKLGAAAPPALAPTALPNGLVAGRYTMFVSTIEPRKGHAMLLGAWHRLAEQGVVGPDSFRLVIVGRRGWMVDQVLAELGAQCADGAVVHLDEATDDMIHTLYRHAAFCVYPSEYEGFGLPVVEAFAHGKAVITTTGGALPEAAAGLACCLDPHDTELWVTTLKSWIEHPDLVRSAEAQVRANFCPRVWPTVAAELIEAAVAG